MSRPAAAASVVPFLCVLFLFLAPAAQSQNLDVFNITYTRFNKSDENTVFATLGDSSINGGALQITPDTQNNPQTYLVEKSGRVLLNKPYKLWHDYTNSSYNSSTTVRRLASFRTVFNVNVYRPDNSTPGEGLAFLIAPDLSGPPPSSYGGFLGLTNKTTDGLKSNNFIAVELDTVKQDYDPDGNHIGLNINSIISNTSASLTPLNITIAPTVPANYTIWIDYDGNRKHIYAYIAREGSPKPTAAVLDWPLDLSMHLQQWSYFGFAGSTGKTYELNCILSWNLTIDAIPHPHKRSTPAWMIATIVTAVLVALVLTLGVVGLCYYRKRMKGVDEISKSLTRLPGMPREFNYKELKKATNNFNISNKLGQGGFGVVYKGVVQGPEGNNIEVAVKMFSRENSRRCQEEFLAELTIINRLRHRNLVRLVGWCHRRGVLLLVYEFMPNGSLDKHLFGTPETPVLPWDRRCNVLVGVATALQYLHGGYDQVVFHRDLKASNIMLDASFQARLGDFGLARAIENGMTASYTEVQGGVRGTFGYIAPECFHTGKATCESEVFSFGAVILEVVSGRPPYREVGGIRCLLDWIWKLHRETNLLAAVDPRLLGDYNPDEAKRLLLLGLACSHPDPFARPKTAELVHIVEGSQPPPPVPPFQPAFVYQPSNGDGSTYGITGSTQRSYSSSGYVTSPTSMITGQHNIEMGRA